MSAVGMIEVSFASLPRHGRVAVVDIGSNSIRLVVFDRPSRSPLPLFNEKVLCGLGRGLDATGRLNEAGVESALVNLARFVRLARAMGATRLDLLATAAVRDAVNGRDFVAEVERPLATVGWLPDLRGHDFYPVGGAWRTLARIHMEQNNYPLHVIQQYRIDRRQAEDLTRVIGRLGKRSLNTIESMPRRRVDTLPFAAILLERLLRLTKPDRVVFSAYGLREGHVYSQLPAAEQRRDPLIEACRELAATEERFGPMGELLQAWLDPLFPLDGAAELRLRLAICHLSDIAWREHPDYRAQHSFNRILHLQMAGIDHPSRAEAAIAVAVRYGAGLDLHEIDAVRGMLDEARQRRSLVVGLALRLAYSLSGATPELLRRTQLVVGNDRLMLRLPRDGEVMSGEAVDRRLEALGRALERETAVVEE